MTFSFSGRALFATSCAALVATALPSTAFAQAPAGSAPVPATRADQAQAGDYDRNYAPPPVDQRYAQADCVRRQQNANAGAGAVIGGLFGALVGAGVSHHGNHGAGAALGGITGAIGGAAIGSSARPQCAPVYTARQVPPPDDYAYQDAPPPAPPAPPPAPGYDAPPGYDAAQGYNVPPVYAAPPVYYDAPPAYAYGGYYGTPYAYGYGYAPTIVIGTSFGRGYYGRGYGYYGRGYYGGHGRRH